MKLGPFLSFGPKLQLLGRVWGLLLASAALGAVSACSFMPPHQAELLASPLAASSTGQGGAGAIGAARAATPATTVDVAQGSPAAGSRKLAPPLTGVRADAVGPVLKCWQDGRLIVETRIQELPSHAASVHTMRDASSGAAIYAFDLQRAFCLAQ